MLYYKDLMDELCDTARMYSGSYHLRHKLFDVLEKHLPHLDEGCKERGCACYDDRLLTPDQKKKVKAAMAELNKAEKKRGWFYRRKEGMALIPGFGGMWDHRSRGFVLVIGKVYLWVRYSMVARKLFVKGGLLRHEEIYCAPHPDFNYKGEVK